MFTSRSMLRWRGWDAWRSGWTPQACRPAIHVFGRRSAFRAQGPGTRRRAPCPATGLASLTPSVSDPGDCSAHALHTLSEPLQRFVTVDRVKRGSLDTRWERAAQPKLPLLTSARSVHRRSRVNPGPLSTPTRSASALATRLSMEGLSMNRASGLAGRSPSTQSVMTAN